MRVQRIVVFSAMVIALALITACGDDRTDGSGASHDKAEETVEDARIKEKLVGIYKEVGAENSYLALMDDGGWTLFSYGSHPRFYNRHLEQWSPAKAQLESFGPSGFAYAIEATDTGYAIQFPIEREAADMAGILAMLGCPDVSEVNYQGTLNPAVGTMIEGTVRPADDAAGGYVIVLRDHDGESLPHRLDSRPNWLWGK